MPGQAAILGLGAVRRLPWEHDGGVALRDVVTLSLSFDHRVVDGEQAARFLADVGALLEDPALALALGGRTLDHPPLDVANGARPGARQREGAPA
ncbi:hypothetical protein BJF88_13270 [Cellulosimicrobium sp. CUA-896]|nr:hypothetical protein BJF88_13270 [Cellulosimicrobium sp. CUA-896]